MGSIGALSTVGIVRAGGAKSRGKDEAEPLSENEIEYARGQLPRYLSGTILDGETTVLVSPPEIKSRYTTAHNIEHTLTIDEANSIREQARLEYIKEYGVDPRNPRAEVIDGNVLRKEKIRELVDQGKLKPGSSADPLHKNDDISTNDATTGPEGGNAGGPIAVDGEIFLTVYPAADSEHSPHRSLVFCDPKGMVPLRERIRCQYLVLRNGWGLGRIRFRGFRKDSTRGPHG